MWVWARSGQTCQALGESDPAKLANIHPVWTKIGPTWSSFGPGTPKHARTTPREFVSSNFRVCSQFLSCGLPGGESSQTHLSHVCSRRQPRAVVVVVEVVVGQAHCVPECFPWESQLCLCDWGSEIADFYGAPVGGGCEEAGFKPAIVHAPLDLPLHRGRLFVMDSSPTFAIPYFGRK